MRKRVTNIAIKIKNLFLAKSLKITDSIMDSDYGLKTIIESQILWMFHILSIIKPN